MGFKKWAVCIMGSLFMTGCRTGSVTMPEKYLLFDVRTLEEYEAGHLSGAVLIPYDTIRERIHVVAPDKSMQVYLYCHSGGRASMARQTMERMGYNHVVNLGGISSASRKTQLQIIK
jgi:phage shock protein E